MHLKAGRKSSLSTPQTALWFPAQSPIGKWECRVCYVMFLLRHFSISGFAMLLSLNVHSPQHRCVLLPVSDCCLGVSCHLDNNARQSDSVLKRSLERDGAKSLVVVSYSPRPGFSFFLICHRRQHLYQFLPSNPGMHQTKGKCPSQHCSLEATAC